MNKAVADMDPLEYIIELLKKYEKLKEEYRIIATTSCNQEASSAAMLVSLSYQSFQTELKTLKIMLEQK